MSGTMRRVTFATIADGSVTPLLDGFTFAPLKTFCARGYATAQAESIGRRFAGEDDYPTVLAAALRPWHRHSGTRGGRKRATFTELSPPLAAAAMPLDHSSRICTLRHLMAPPGAPFSRFANCSEMKPSANWLC